MPDLEEGPSTGTEAAVDFSYPSKEDRNADTNYILKTTGMKNPEVLLGLSDPKLRRAYHKVRADEDAGRYDKRGSRTSSRNIGGIIEDTERGPISYSKGGAVKGKTFRGSF